MNYNTNAPLKPIHPLGTSTLNERQHSLRYAPQPTPATYRYISLPYDKRK